VINTLNVTVNDPTYNKSGSVTGVVSLNTGITCPPSTVNIHLTCTAGLWAGSTLTLTESHSPPTQFLGWSGDCTGTAPTCTVSMAQARNVGASFGPDWRPLSVTIGGSTVGTVNASLTGLQAPSFGGSCSYATPGTPHNCTIPYALGSTVTLTIPSSLPFVGWSGDCTGSARTCTVTMDQARNVTAIFQ
jgi:hypothetical protein